MGRSQARSADGEAVLLAFQGISDFDGLHSGKYDEEVRLYAFDILALDGDDLRKLSLSTRKQHLSRLLKLRSDRIFVAPRTWTWRAQSVGEKS